MAKLTNRNSRGFTILELLIGMVVFLTISGAVLIGMGQLQLGYRSSQVNTQMQQQLRSTMELMAAEIGQAGLQASTVEGANTMGSALIAAPYTLDTTLKPITTPGPYTVNVTLNSAAPVFPIYVGQWLQVDGGTNQEAVQVTAFGSGTPRTVTATFNSTHTAASTAAYPMGVFPHGILAGSTINGISDPSSASVTGGKLVMYGEINGSGNGLYAVEYACPATSSPGAFVRSQWDLSITPPVKTSYNLIDNVTSCYFCWPGVLNSTNPNCPTTANPQTVTLPDGVTGSTVTYSIITQVGFTITASEVVTGLAQPVTVTKSYSNIQPRNLITALNIYNAACTSAVNAGTNPCTLNGAYAGYLNGELQPDPIALTNMTANGQW